MALGKYPEQKKTYCRKNLCGIVIKLRMYFILSKTPIIISQIYFEMLQLQTEVMVTHIFIKYVALIKHASCNLNVIVLSIWYE
jgi:hypothetical protein